jgi:hypothetical protein
MAEEPALVAPLQKLAQPQLFGASGRSLAAVAMAVLLGLGVFGLAGSEAVTKGDRISKAEAAKLAERFRHFSGALLPVDMSSKPQRDKLVHALSMAPAEAERLMALVERGERMLGWLTLWDNFDEDGDIASVTAAGFTQSVPLPMRQSASWYPTFPASRC